SERKLNTADFSRRAFRRGISAISARSASALGSQNRSSAGRSGGLDMTNSTIDDPATLVAVLIAARRVGNRDLEREMRRGLADAHGLRLVFVGTTDRPRGGYSHDR